MRSWCLLLGLLTMTILRVSSGDCSNGFAGLQAFDICCEAHCEMCGGDGCSQQDGGADSCCTSNIRDNGELCSTTLEAPCIIDENVCSNGIVGVQASDICCEAQCGTCGGSGCSQRPGGMIACCTNTIRGNERVCSTTLAAPCIVDDGNASKGEGCTLFDFFVALSAACRWTFRGKRRGECFGKCRGECRSECRDVFRGVSCGKHHGECRDMPEAVCDNGVPGVQANSVCCEAQCEICGGSGCSQRPGGMDACCTDTIRANDELCTTTMEAPCVIEY